MRRFSFKLGKLLELRRHAEQEWELKLAEVTGRVVAAEQEIEDLGRKRLGTRRYHANSGTLDMSLMHSREDYVNRIDQRVLALHHQLVALEVERSKVRDGYVEASKKRKALTRLKERRETDYYREARREDGRVIDEIGSTQLILRRREMEEIDV